MADASVRLCLASSGDRLDRDWLAWVRSAARGGVVRGGVVRGGVTCWALERCGGETAGRPRLEVREGGVAGRAREEGARVSGSGLRRLADDERVVRAGAGRASSSRARVRVARELLVPLLPSLRSRLGLYRV
jgi:hypothetical protein